MSKITVRAHTLAEACARGLKRVEEMRDEDREETVNNYLAALAARPAWRRRLWPSPSEAQARVDCATTQCFTDIASRFGRIKDIFTELSSVAAIGGVEGSTVEIDDRQAHLLRPFWPSGKPGDEILAPD